MKNNNICNEGTVKEVLDNALRIESVRHSACSGCHAKSICIAGNQKDEILTLSVEAPSRFQIGEKVNIYMEQSVGIKAILLAYFFPFLILFITLFIIVKLTNNELIAFFSAISSTAIYYAILWLLNKKKIIDKHFVLKVTKKEEIH